VVAARIADNCSSLPDRQLRKALPMY